MEERYTSFLQAKGGLALKCHAYGHNGLHWPSIWTTTENLWADQEGSDPTHTNRYVSSDLQKPNNVLLGADG